MEVKSLSELEDQLSVELTEASVTAYLTKCGGTKEEILDILRARKLLVDVGLRFQTESLVEFFYEQLLSKYRKEKIQQEKAADLLKELSTILDQDL